MSLARFSLLVAVVLCGLSAGFFYSYESSVTLGLATVDDETYVAAFQGINDRVRNPAFGIVFFGSVPAITAALVLNWGRGRGPRWLIATALVLYLTLIAITGIGTVALNNELADVTAITPASAAQARAHFETDWNRLNLARTAVVVGGFALLTAAAIGPQRTVPTDPG